jgi:nitroreductase
VVRFEKQTTRLSHSFWIDGRRARCRGEEISTDELMCLFEAARWAPSSFNAQQWRALYARRGSEHWPIFLGLLVEGNKAWAKNAAVLVLFISRTTFEYDGDLYS